MGATTGPYASPGPATGPYSGANSGDNMRITVTLTRKQWREILAAIGGMESGPQDVLWDALEDLGDDRTPGQERYRT